MDMMMTRSQKKLLITGLLVLGFIYLLYRGGAVPDISCPKTESMSKKTSMISSDGTLYEYDRQSPLIFIGGVPRSGTTLMRAMLDAHPDVRCGEETRVVPRLLQMRSHWKKSQKESMRLEEAGLTDDVLASAISSFYPRGGGQAWGARPQAVQ